MSSKNSPVGATIARQTLWNPERRPPSVTEGVRRRFSNRSSFQYMRRWKEGIEMKPPREEQDVRERHRKSHGPDFPVDFFAGFAPRAFPAHPAFRASLAFLASLALTLPGCSMGPDYTRPETPSADAWRMTATTSESIANLPWWELLKDQ